MHLIRLAYASTVVPGFSRSDLLAIGTTSHARNPGKEITGALLLCEGRFLQVIEGGQLAVTELFTRIAADTRHREVRILDAVRVPNRRFPAWSMKWMHAADAVAIRDILLRYQDNPGFDPNHLNGESASELLSELGAVL